MMEIERVISYDDTLLVVGYAGTANSDVLYIPDVDAVLLQKRICNGSHLADNLGVVTAAGIGMFFLVDESSVFVHDAYTDLGNAYFNPYKILHRIYLHFPRYRYRSRYFGLFKTKSSSFNCSGMTATTICLCFKSSLSTNTLVWL